MASESIRRLARQLDVPERTLRRAAAQGLVHGERTSARRFRTSLREEAYLRVHWPLLRELRDALRTEPSVRLAVLFGSLATGRATPRSDVDLLIELADPAASRVARVAGRLERRIARTVQLVRLQDAEKVPMLMASGLEHGRVLVDRAGLWPQLKATEAAWRQRAATAESALEDVLPNLDLS